MKTWQCGQAIGYGRGSTNRIQQDACRLPFKDGMKHWRVEAQVLETREAI